MSRNSVASLLKKSIHDLTFPADLMKEMLMFMKECPEMPGESSHAYVRKTEGFRSLSPWICQYLFSQELHSQKTKDHFQLL